MIATSIEQSKKLLELGINPETADMWYSYYGNSKYNSTIAYEGQQWFLCQIRNSRHDDIPCWSLNALIELLPEIKGTPFVIQKFKTENNNYYNLEYEGIIMLPYCKSLVDGCVEMIEKLKKENLL